MVRRAEECEGRVGGSDPLGRWVNGPAAPCSGLERARAPRLTDFVHAIRAELPSVRRQPKKTWPWGQGGGRGQA